MDSKKLRVKCTYATCSKHFETEKEMKRHKKEDPEHDYCKKCDVDCKDWNDFTQHKVKAMMPWLAGRMKGNKEELPKHIVCEFCGTDFKSFAGRKAHREQAHKADQDIPCPGCQHIFRRAGDYVEHIENGRCLGISPKEFKDSIQQKRIVQEYMANPEAFAAGFRVNKNYLRPGDMSGTAEGSETHELEEGGVPLLDQEDPNQKEGHQPLKVDIDCLDFKAETSYKLRTPDTRAHMETWPRLPGQMESDIHDSMRKMSISSATPSEQISEVSASDYASSITSRRGGNKVFTESPFSPKSPMPSTSFAEEDDDAASVVTVTSGGQKSAWSKGNSSKILFRDAEPTPVPGDYAAYLQRMQAEDDKNNGRNMFYSHFWDPSSEEYDIEIFYNSMIGKYTCPWPDCGVAYEESHDLQGHFREAHLKRNFVCPLCLKRFKQAHALISHAESAGCRVKETSMFDKLLDEVSGGFLTAEQLKQPKVYKTLATAKSGKDKVADGVMATKFEAKMPHEK